MPVIQIVPDRFKVGEKKLLDKATSDKTSSENHIRRPVRGIVYKDDSFATLRVVAGSGEPVKIIDAGSRRKEGNDFMTVGNKRATDIYSNFFIQQVNEERAEKQQILETFGEPFIFLFGERARVVSFQGVLLNTFDFNWEAEWWHNYDNYLRGTKCVENDARVFISFDETIVTGYIIASSAVKTADQRNHVQFQFQMFVTGYTNYSKIGDPNALPGILPNAFKGAVTDETLAPFRPSIIDTSLQTGKFGSRPVMEGGVLGDFSLSDGLLTNIDRISQTFNSIKNQAEGVIKRLSDLANGTVIRVPVGFAGALEFDTDPSAFDMTITNGKINYSTFDQNTDEYVGSSDHYGSSVNANGAFRFGATADEIVNQNLQRDQAMVNKATEIWAAAGFTVPSSDEFLVSSLLVKTGFGLAAIGSNAAWKSQLPNSSLPISSASPIRGARPPSLVEE
jgi:hypothetical protein